MLRNCLLDFFVEHWFGCRATEPGFAGDIGAIEVWLIDWLKIKRTKFLHIDRPQKDQRSRQVSNLYPAAMVELEKIVRSTADMYYVIGVISNKYYVY